MAGLVRLILVEYTRIIVYSSSTSNTSTLILIYQYSEISCRETFQTVEYVMKALMIASLAHDVGHPGLNDAYLKKVRCTLATMYSDPLLEHHHFQTCLLILQ
ncbi:PDEase domain-containing protein, partial [Caerostris darwini]